MPTFRGFLHVPELPHSEVYPSPFDRSQNDDQMIPSDTPEVREGLPPTYRMRHDRHYVDQLGSPSGVIPIRVLAIKDIDAPARDMRHLGPLVASIREVGMLQPVLVRPREGRYELITGAKRMAAAVAAGLTEVPCRIYEEDDVRTQLLAEADNVRAIERSEPTAQRGSSGSLVARGLDELATSVKTLRLCLTLLSEDVRPSFHRAIRGLSEAELQRASCLVDGWRILSDEPTLERQRVRLDTLLHEVLTQSASERRLAGGDVVIDGESPPLMVRADAGLLRTAIVGALHAIIALAQANRSATPRVGLRLFASEANPATLEISERGMTPSAVLLARFFDYNWAERPGGCSATTGVVAAKRVADLHGGWIEAAPLDGGGCRLTLTIPRG